VLLGDKMPALKQVANFVSGATLAKVSLTTVFLATGFFTFNIQPLSAQVLPDGSLPTSVTTSGTTVQIDNGARSGGNLFHSFSQFSLPTGTTVRFNNAADVQNIFARVTGDRISNIDGRIQAGGIANLFLLNPNGIVFGPNATLDLRGSFLATTASSMRFADGTVFSTIPTAAPMLTVSVPIGLQMGGNPGAIVNQARTGVGFQRYPTGLNVPNGQNLALIGRDIVLDAGGLQAREGAIELGSVTANSVVGFQTGQNPWKFDYQGATGFGDITVRQAMVNTSGNGAGSITATGRNVVVEAGGRLMARNLEGTTKDAMGDIRIRASQLFELKGGFPFPNSGCTGGYCNSLVSTITQGGGDAGNVIIDAPTIRVLDGGQIGLGVRGTTASGDGGTMIMNANAVEISGVTQWPGVSFSSGVFGWVSNGGSGRGGNVVLNTNTLRLTNGGQLSVSARSNFGSNRGENATSVGTAGNIQVNARDWVELSGVGTGLNGAINPSNIDASVASDAIGAGGNVNIQTDRLLVSDGGRISSSTAALRATGDAGKVSIQARDILVTGQYRSDYRSEINASSSSSAAAGTVQINADQITLSDNGRISVNSSSIGEAGNIEINAGTVLIKNQASLLANMNGGNDARLNVAATSTEGNIRIKADALVLRRESRISTNSSGDVEGGNITIDAGSVIGLENSDIIANAQRGRGGNIQITTNAIYGLAYRDQLTPDNDITASSTFGVNGSVQISKPGVDPNAAVTELPVNLIDPNQQVAQGCKAEQGSRFIMSGRGGKPENPTEQTQRASTWNDTRTIASSNLSHRQNPSRAAKPEAPTMIAEAAAWRRNANGEVELVAIGQTAASPTIASCNPAASQPDQQLVKPQNLVKTMHLSKADGNHRHVAQSWHIGRN
jgi:filamentous hemagglutinin family protein